MDFVFGLPKNLHGNTDSIDGESIAELFIDRGFRQHGLPVAIVSDRDPRFTSKFWKSVFQVLGTRLYMSTADHP
ncbi:unnamed protein product [Peronospora effusa]|nr:unnamed protein product [Peronospora effusa]